MLTDTVLSTFKASLRGELITPGDQRYDEARRVYNGMIDRRPRLIARCVDVADVMAAVNFGRDNKLLISVRGGGHNAGGLGVCDDGLVIDLSSMRYVRVDPKKRTIRAGGGALWGDVDHAGHAPRVDFARHALECAPRGAKCDERRGRIGLVPLFERRLNRFQLLSVHAPAIVDQDSQRQVQDDQCRSIRQWLEAMQLIHAS